MSLLSRPGCPPSWNQRTCSSPRRIGGRAGRLRVLERLCVRLREGASMGMGPELAAADAVLSPATRCRQLLCGRQCQREGSAMRVSRELRAEDAMLPPHARRDQSQCGYQRMREGAATRTRKQRMASAADCGALVSPRCPVVLRSGWRARDACPKSGDLERGLRLLRKISAAGAQADIVLDPTLAWPFSQGGRGNKAL